VNQLKVEILLPQNYNDSTQIEGHKFSTTFDEMFDQFHACTIDKSPLVGRWLNLRTKKTYTDNNIAYWVICDDNYDSMYFLDNYKKKLEERFKQDSILIYSTTVVIFETLHAS
jgi:hypothetical protein